MMDRKKLPFHGWIALDKPYGMTSSQAIGAVKRILRPQKIGHAGTLDPLATGGLPLALGEATKLVPYAMDALKEYEFTIRFGEARNTDDAEGEVVDTSDIRPSRNDIENMLHLFIGEIEQIPPSFSALKVDGRRAYDLARQGKPVELKPRMVNIETLELIDMPDTDSASFRVSCGKGTYIRSLARDIAAALGTCGYVSLLRRTRVGKFNETALITLDNLEKIVLETAPQESGGHFPFLLPLSAALDDIPAVQVDAGMVRKLRHGMQILVSPPFIEKGENGSIYQAVYKDTVIAMVKRTGRKFAPVRVLNT
jgi:tRNA pseudouridine55 synthase